MAITTKTKKIDILMIDNYDSFTFNLVQYLGILGENIKVRRNDRITVDEIKSMSPSRIVISPVIKEMNLLLACIMLTPVIGWNPAFL